jgi:hypothetical protein
MQKTFGAKMTGLQSYYIVAFYKNCKPRFCVMIILNTNKHYLLVY